MEPEVIDVPEVIETPEPEAETVEPEVPEETPEDKIVRLETEKAELEDKNKKLYARVKKDEKKEPTVPSKPDELSPKDLYALMNEKVPQEDVDEVVRAAKALNLTIPEALKSNIVKSILSEKAEERTTAQATQKKGGARGVSKVSGEDLLLEAEKTGQLPESEEDIQKLFLARRARRLQN